MSIQYNRPLLYIFSAFKRFYESKGVAHSNVFLKNKLFLTQNLFINAFLMKEYAAFFLFVFICFVFSFILYLVAKNVNKEVFYNEKSAPYECGFEAFSDARGRINVHFYVVALLFVIFDVEVIYFLPWAINLYSLGFCGYAAIFIFNIFLIAGFIYEWSRGVFDWAKPKKKLKKSADKDKSNVI